MLRRVSRLSPVALGSSGVFLLLVLAAVARVCVVRVNSSARVFFLGLLLVPIVLHALMLAQCLLPRKDPKASFGVAISAWVGAVWVLFLFGL